MTRICKLALVTLLVTCGWTFAVPSAAARDPLPPLTPAKHDALYKALVHGRLSEPEYALARARSLFALGQVRAQFGHVARPDPHAATLILRDLVVRAHALSGRERTEARGLLARPDGVPAFNGEPTWDFDAEPRSDCPGGRPLCFHWDDNFSNRDAPPAADGDANGVPDQVESTEAVLDNVWDTETGVLGYRQPLADTTTTLNDGGGPQLDIYLADLGVYGLFGYCTTDDPHAFAFTAPWDVSAYCVLDDDYRQRQYGFGQSPLEFLQVTAAHEFFHAVQFSYDWFEDLALMEGTAMWMEGQVYPSVIDRIRYLDRSALARPGVPLDTGANGFEYGAWLFWRYLTEKVFGDDPTIIREIWERADGSTSNAFGDEYSFQAAKRALAAHGLDFADVFADFGATNDLRDYSEADLGYPVAPLAGVYRLGAQRRSSGWVAPTMRHLTTRFYRFRPARHAAAHGRLHVAFDLPGSRTNAEATAVVYRRGGGPLVRHFALAADGDGHRSVDFGRSDVWKVDLVLSNGSLRFDCPAKDFPETVYSCGGSSLDDRRVFRFRAKVG
jgi:hypothetical protein